MAQINLSMRDYCETIPHFDGDPLNISTFISSCDSFVQILARPNDAAFNSFLFRAIISKLKGKAAQIASVRNTTSWDALRTLVSNNIQTSQQSILEHVAALRQNKIDLYRGLALQTFINGLRESMRIIMQCRTPANLEEALNYAQEQENLQMQKHNAMQNTSKLGRSFKLCTRTRKSSNAETILRNIELLPISPDGNLNDNCKEILPAKFLCSNIELLPISPESPCDVN
ncbi:hypothetical protein QE152_g10980 [Popillia japonica]|uniref:Uncharacterized protein n=1 Tax=Popillia japonica TaxID=7064 RepID=A0AAW1LSW9_POPJA